MNVATLLNYIQNGQETLAINFLKEFKPSDLLFIKGSENIVENIHNIVWD